MTTLREALDAVTQADAANAVAGAAARATAEALEAAKATLQGLMEEQGTDIARNEDITVTIVDKARPHVQDWDAFYSYLKRSGALQLLERRVSAKAFTEVLESRGGKDVPGVSTYDYKQLSIRRGK